MGLTDVSSKVRRLSGSQGGRVLERAKLGVERWCDVVDKKSNGQKKKLRRKVGTTKAGRKKTSRTNIISKDFF